MMYERVGKISEERRSLLLSQLPPFKQNGGDGPRYTTNYKATIPIKPDQIDCPELAELVSPNRWLWGFATCLDPGGYLHKHNHGSDDKKECRYHVVLATNANCESWNGDESFCLEDLGIYWMQPGLDHQSFNRGETTRIHLVIFVEIEHGND